MSSQSQKEEAIQVVAQVETYVFVPSKPFISHSKAVSLDQNNPSFFANRAAAFYETGHYVGALSDCTTALKLLNQTDKLAIKVALRKAKCLFFMGRHEDCLDVLQQTASVSLEVQRLYLAADHFLRLEYARNHVPEHNGVVHVDPFKLRRTLTRRRATIQPFAPYQIFSEDVPVSVLEPMPDVLFEKTLDPSYLAHRIKTLTPICIVLAGAGDPRHLFATMTHLDMILNEMGSNAPQGTALEIIVCNDNPAVLARTILIFDAMLELWRIMAGCKESSEIMIDDLEKINKAEGPHQKEILEQATYLSHLFFGYKLPQKFAVHLSTTLKAAISRSTAQTDLLCWVEAQPKSWKKIQRVMNTWTLRNRFPEDVLDRQISEILGRRQSVNSIQKQDILEHKCNELREIAANSEWRNTFFHHHLEKGVVPKGLNALDYVQYLIGKVAVSSDIIEPICWPLCSTYEDRKIFDASKKLSIPKLVRDTNLSEALLAGYKHPWEVAEQLLSVNPLRYDYHNHHLNKLRSSDEYHKSEKATTFCDDLTHFWQSLALRTKRCIDANRIRLQLVPEDPITYFRNPVSNDSHNAANLDRVIVSRLLTSFDYLELLTTFEPMVRGSPLGGVFCTLDTDKCEYLTDTREMLQGLFCVDHDHLDNVLDLVFNVRLIGKHPHLAHVFAPTDRTPQWKREEKFNDHSCQSVNITRSQKAQQKQFQQQAIDEQSRVEEKQKPLPAPQTNSSRKKKNKRKKKKSMIETLCSMDGSTTKCGTANVGLDSNVNETINGDILAMQDIQEHIFKLQQPGVQSFLTQQNISNFLIHLLITCVAPSSFISKSNLASWFHLVAKICIEGRTPRHWIATLVDTVAADPHVVSTSAFPFQMNALRSTTSKLSLRPIATEFRTLLHLWLGKIPCLVVMPSIAAEQVVRVYIRFNQPAELSIEDHRFPLTLVIYKKSNERSAKLNTGIGSHENNSEGFKSQHAASNKHSENFTEGEQLGETCTELPTSISKQHQFSTGKSAVSDAPVGNSRPDLMTLALNEFSNLHSNEPDELNSEEERSHVHRHLTKTHTQSSHSEAEGSSINTATTTSSTTASTTTNDMSVAKRGAISSLQKQSAVSEMTRKFGLDEDDNLLEGPFALSTGATISDIHMFSCISYWRKVASCLMTYSAYCQLRFCTEAEIYLVRSVDMRVIFSSGKFDQRSSGMNANIEPTVDNIGT